ncbi:CLUMA_CG011439, isoform A [Clunio marinus]|uniref:CLUMA_CG011439, isoform A n=1 Tax=Clunio marinus TaxID=568069 RepID=A0A1J1IG98_9DIPT|nr:CLUMA_CG011439, isoform A [Clunio marinus]
MRGKKHLSDSQQWRISVFYYALSVVSCIATPHCYQHTVTNLTNHSDFSNDVKLVTIREHRDKTQ